MARKINTNQTRFAKAAKLLNQAFANEPITYKVDRKTGFQSRDTSSRWLTEDEIRYFFKNLRATDEQEFLQEMGRWFLNYALAKEYVVESYGMLWVTTKAQETYNLPNPVLADGSKSSYKKV